VIIGRNNWEGSLKVIGNQSISGSLYFGSGSSITETSSSIIITPPGALIGQSFVIRPTAVQIITSNHPSGFADGDSITLTIQPDNGGLVTGTIGYTFTGATAEQLGRALTGTLTFSNQQQQTLSWGIPANSNIIDFTFTLGTPSGFSFGGVGNTYITLTRTSSSEDYHIHLVSGDPSMVDIYLGDDDQYVKIVKGGGDVVIGTNTNTHHWTFDTSGSFNTPGDINISGSINVTGSFTASLREGYVWVGDNTGKNTLQIATSSFGVGGGAGTSGTSGVSGTSGYKRTKRAIKYIL